MVVSPLENALPVEPDPRLFNPLGWGLVKGWAHVLCAAGRFRPTVVQPLVIITPQVTQVMTAPYATPPPTSDLPRKTKRVERVPRYRDTRSTDARATHPPTPGATLDPPPLLPRYCPAGATYLVTRRCFGGTFLLVPQPWSRHLSGYCGVSWRWDCG